MALSKSDMKERHKIKDKFTFIKIMKYINETTWQMAK